MSLNNTVQLQNTVDPKTFRKKMLRWYEKHRRVLPWRALPNEVPDPYHVWLSEIMLQQTTVQAVIPYFINFTQKWPTIYGLAQADNDDVMHNWAGLGYYARARNLHKCAKHIVSDHGGVFPSNQSELKKLSGIGEYTSAAITSIAFDKPSVVVDGNVERVMARLHAVEAPVPKGKSILKEYAAYYSEGFSNSPGDYAQSLMDLGATICTPKSPKCSICPISNYCQAHATCSEEKYPVRESKKVKPNRYGYVYWITNNKGEVLIHKRPDKGLLGGMYGFPTTEWREDNAANVHPNFIINQQMNKHKTTIKHVFTHFNLYLTIFWVSLDENDIPHNYLWVSKNKINEIGLPTTFDKVRKIMFKQMFHT